MNLMNQLDKSQFIQSRVKYLMNLMNQLDKSQCTQSRVKYLMNLIISQIKVSVLKVEQNTFV